MNNSGLLLPEVTVFAHLTDRLSYRLNFRTKGVRDLGHRPFLREPVGGQHAERVHDPWVALRVLFSAAPLA